MVRVRKFAKGAPFETVADVVEDILDGKWVFLNHKPTHPGWASGWSITTIRNMIGHLYRANVTPEWEADRGRRLKEVVGAAIADAASKYPMKEIVQ